jgi:hypothetical protein
MLRPPDAGIPATAGMQTDTACPPGAGLFPRMARVLDLTFDDAAAGLCFIVNQPFVSGRCCSLPIANTRLKS